MKQILLTQGKFTLVDDEDFEFLNQWKWYLSNTGYAVRAQWLKKENKQVKILMHRVILNINKYILTDHINRNRLDNRRKNLRMCNKSQNAANSKLEKYNKYGYRGLTKHFNKWRAVIVADKKRYHLGLFSTKREAAQAYNQAAKQYFGEFAFINKI